MTGPLYVIVHDDGLGPATMYNTVPNPDLNAVQEWATGLRERHVGEFEVFELRPVNPEETR